MNPNVVNEENEQDRDKYLRSQYTAITRPEQTNEFLSEKERLEREQLEKDSDHKYEYLYPHLSDPNFNVKIAERKEFFDTRYDVDPAADVEAQAELLCNAPFELAPNQHFVRNFLSFQTPYNGMLLYHGLGTGKTCSAISVAEEMRDYLKQMGIVQRIIVVASPNVQQNFRLQLFDERKLQEVEPGVWNIRACTGNKYLKEINPMNMKGLGRDHVIRQITRMIDSSYLFLGYTEFANYVRRVASADDSVAASAASAKGSRRTPGATATATANDVTANNLSISKLKRNFTNRLIIVDEVHNIRITDENKDKRVAEIMYYLAKHVDNLRMLLLSGTPMYNSYKEIIWLINLLNVNDGRATIDVKDVFDKNGNFRMDEDGNLVGRDLLVRKATGYVSFVRGENPYTFPYRIFPDLFAPEHTFKTRAYPATQMNGRAIVQGLEHINVFLTDIGDIQAAGYDYIIASMRKEAEAEAEAESEASSGGGGGSGGGSNKETEEETEETEETEEHDETEETEEASRSSSSSNSSSDEETETETETVAFPTFENMESIGYTMLQRPLEALNIVYPHESLVRHIGNPANHINIKAIVGKEGLRHVMRYTERITPPFRGDFEYRADFLKAYGEEDGRIFSPQHIGRYSCKIKAICDHVMNSTGIVLIYSQYIDGGVVPIALALEELGFTRYSKTNTSLFKTAPTNPIDALTFLPKGQHAEKGGKGFMPARYAMITGDKALSPDNVYELKALTDEDNKYGSKVKVVIISKAGSEGLDFKNIRQVHVLEPWYNMNLIEQIIGRAIRHCSHKQLPFRERNVELFLYGTLLERDEEAADLYLYRLSEVKAVKIGVVSRVLRETAVDCILNVQHNTLKYDDINRVMAQHLSNGQVIQYQVGAKPYSSLCDYMQSCDYVCRPDVPDVAKKGANLATFSERFIMMNTDKIIQKIRDLYREHYFYKKTELIARLNAVREYPLAQINMALTLLIDDSNEYLVDKYGRLGHLKNIGEYYMYQPVELSRSNVSIYERSAPIPVKHEYVRVNLSEAVTTETAATKASASASAAKAPEPVAIEGHDDAAGKLIVDRIAETYKMCLTVYDKPDKSQDEWYYYCGKVMTYMSMVPQLRANIELMHQLIVSNLVEHLFYNDHLLLLNYLHRKTAPLTEMEHMIKEYYDGGMLRRPVFGKRAGGSSTAEDKAIMLYRHGRVGPQLVVLRYNANKPPVAWVPAESEDERDFSAIMKELQAGLVAHLNSIVGFVTMFKTEFMIFKVKAMADKRSKGARCDQAGKADVIAMINRILQLNTETKDIEFTAKNTRERSQKEMCVLEEFMLRVFNAHRNNGRRWFLSPAEGALCNVEGLYIA